MIPGAAPCAARCRLVPKTQNRSHANSIKNLPHGLYGAQAKRYFRKPRGGAAGCGASSLGGEKRKTHAQASPVHESRCFKTDRRGTPRGDGRVSAASAAVLLPQEHSELVRLLYHSPAPCQEGLKKFFPGIPESKDRSAGTRLSFSGGVFALRWCAGSPQADGAVSSTRRLNSCTRHLSTDFA